MRSERQRIYECVINWPDVTTLEVEFAESECRMAASALHEAVRLGDKASEAHAVILRRWPMMSREDQATAASLAKNGGKWWLELLAEFEGCELGVRG